MLGMFIYNWEIKMSGIYGSWQPGQELINQKGDMDRLMQWNRAYGKTEGHYLEKDAGMGCFVEKLSVDAVESSPVLHRNGIYAVIDAVIYNREELNITGSEQLSDEELLLRYVQEQGMNALKNVNGDFAGALYDPVKQKMTLFRDHMGVRPLFYAADEHGVVFSTDMRGILAMDRVEAAVNDKWLWDRISGSASMDSVSTEFAHIHCVRPASFMEFSLKDERLQWEQAVYWKLGVRKIRYRSEQQYIDKMRELITDAVKRRLDVISGPIGAELSGGLDSGVISILINRLGREGIFFSWSASPEALPLAERDERLIIQDICAQEGIECNYGGLTIKHHIDSVICKKLQEIGLQINMNENASRMYVLPPYINTLQIYEAARFIQEKGARVVFTGHGGDEGVSHRPNAYELFYHKEYLSYVRYMWEWTRDGKHRIYHTLRRCYKDLTQVRKQFTSSYEDVFAVKDILSAEITAKYQDAERPPLKFTYDPKAFINQGGSRNRLEVVALLGAYSGVRYMVPFVDYRVIDYAVSIPRHMYLKNRTRRYIYREAFKDILPESLYTLNCKEDNSWKNRERVEQREEDYIDKKKRMVAMLEREYWERYLNFDRLEEWAATPYSEENTIRDKGVGRAISNCVLLQNAVKRAPLVKVAE